MADALWEVSSSKLCVVLGGVLVKQQYHYLHWWRNNTTCIVIACSPYLYHAPRSHFVSSAVVSSLFVFCVVRLSRSIEQL